MKPYGQCKNCGEKIILLGGCTWRHLHSGKTECLKPVDGLYADTEDVESMTPSDEIIIARQNERMKELEKERDLLLRECEAAYKMLDMLVDDFTDEELEMPKHEHDFTDPMNPSMCIFCCDFSFSYYKYLEARKERLGE